MKVSRVPWWSREPLGAKRESFVVSRGTSSRKILEFVVRSSWRMGWVKYARKAVLSSSESREIGKGIIPEFQGRQVSEQRKIVFEDCFSFNCLIRDFSGERNCGGAGDSGGCRQGVGIGL